MNAAERLGISALWQWFSVRFRGPIQAPLNLTENQDYRLAAPFFCQSILLWLTVTSVFAQQGLKGEYYQGTNFERKVFTRIDPQLNFNWRGRSPAPGLSDSYYSIRWTGKLQAPTSGQYRFSAKVDDGIRIWVGNKLVMDSWQLNDSQSFVGSVVLEAGRFYDLRIDFFNDMLEGEIQVYWQRPDEKRLFPDQFTTPGDPIPARYLFQKVAPKPVTSVKTPAKPVSISPTVASVPPKPILPKRPVRASSMPVSKPALPPKVAVVSVAPTVSTPVSSTLAGTPEPEFKAGTTFILHNVQFEQSSYILLPESSAELDKLVLAMKENAHRSIDIAGHTDNIGDPRLNLALSENRAKVVASYLKRRGIADNRITTTGYGGTRPIADNSTEGERAKNRRVEITIK